MVQFRVRLKMAPPKWLLIFLAPFSLLFVVVVAATATAAAEGHLLFLEDRSFEARSRVWVSYLEQQLAKRHDLLEAYSVERKRARIDVRLDMKIELGQNGTVNREATSGTYFIDMEAPQAILFHDRNLDTCWRVEQPVGVIRGIGVNLIDSLESRVAPEHIIGPARIIYQVARSRQRLKFVRSTQIRNIPALRYDFNITSKAGLKVEFAVYFRQGDDIQSPTTFPLRAAFVSALKEVAVDFASVRILDADHLDLAQREPLGSGSLKSFDRFTFSPLRSCSTWLQDKALDLLARKGSNPSLKFSFRARVEYFSEAGRQAAQVVGHQTDLFVAYDSNLHSMRVDTSDPQTGDELSRQIHNFKLARSYHVSRPRKSINPIDGLLDLDSRTSDCALSSLPEDGAGNNSAEYTLGQLLTGVERLIPLGWAEVRGIEARVFEASSSDVPFWLETPVVYQLGANLEPRIRWPEAKNQATLTSLLYFVNGPMDEPHLLMLEIFHKNSAYSQLIDNRRAVMIHDFRWQLAASPTGDRASELFSLKDDCVSKADGGHEEVGSVELLLERSSKGEHLERSDWIWVASFREQALLGALQESLELAAPMVHDLETRLVSSSAPRQPERLYVTFRNAKHLSRLPRLILLGQGRLRKDFQLDHYPVHSFQACFMLVVHLELDIYFAYSAARRLCLVNPAAIDYSRPAAALNSQPDGFELLEGRPLEVYRVHGAVDFANARRGEWTRSNSHYGGHFRWLDRRIKLTFDRPETSVFFTIKRLDVKPSVGTLAGNSSDQVDDAILGFGLDLLDAENNRPVDAATSQQCQARCLSEPECESYSTCERNFRQTCTLSRLSFRSVRLLHQPGSSRGQKVGLEVGDRRVDLVQQAGCSIRNRKYVDFFELQPGRVQVPLLGTSLEQVVGLEGCAGACARRNIKLLGHEGVDSEGSEGATATGGSRRGPMDLRQFRRIVTESVCFDFMYFDWAEVDRLESAKRRKFIERLYPEAGDELEREERFKSGAGGGFCLRDERMELESADWLEPRRYHFKATYLFEETPNLGLLASEKGQAEAEAYQRVRSGEPAEERHVETMRAFVGRGENSQVVVSSERTNCAMLCLTQTVNPWPACRSFDIAIEQVNGQMLVRCRLNSVTLSELLARGRHELLLLSNSTGARMWHYEPRAGLVSASSSLFARIELGGGEMSLRPPVALGPFGVSAVVLFALISGLTLSLSLRERITRTRAQRSVSSSSFASSVELSPM